MLAPVDDVARAVDDRLVAVRALTDRTGHVTRRREIVTASALGARRIVPHGTGRVPLDRRLVVCRPECGTDPDCGCRRSVPALGSRQQAENDQATGQGRTQADGRFGRNQEQGSFRAAADGAATHEAGHLVGTVGAV